MNTPSISHLALNHDHFPLNIATTMIHGTMSLPVYSPFARSIRALSTERPSGSSSVRSPRANHRRPLARRPGADQIGAPDPVSNLRPVQYGSAFDEVDEMQASPSLSHSSATIARTGSSTQTGLKSQLPHPYSLNEFHVHGGNTGTFPSTRNGSGRVFGSETVGSRYNRHSKYYQRLLERLEGAELSRRLRLAHADAFSHAFWTDNNVRFRRALEDYLAQNHSTLTDAAPGGPNLPSKSSNDLSPQHSPDDYLAPFYAAWLSANSERHRMYNRALWSSTLRDLMPAANYGFLKLWVQMVRNLEITWQRAIY